MKSILKNIIAICLLMYTITTYSQVNVAVSGMTYISGTPISNCGNIDFGTNPTVRVQFGITLTKPTNQVVGVSNLYVYSIGSSGSRIERKNEIVQPTSFDTYYTSSGDITMSESDFNTSGGTLFAIFKSSSNIEYQTTCSYTITKTLSPTFSLLPTSLSLACGDTSAKTFTVTPANIPNGATLTYNWSYSSSGWSGSTSNTNSITLSPSSGSNLPTNVSVTPVLNGVAQPTKTCIVTRAPFTQTAAIISGGNSICTPATSGVYSISNQGTNTVTWSSSNTAIATVSSTTGTSITVNKVSNGTFNLVARITNACNQYLDVTKSIRIGSSPSFNVTKVANTGGYDLAIVNVPSTENQGITSATWVKTSGNGTITGYGLTAEAHGSPTSAWTVTANITATNDCGSTTISKTYSSAGDGTHKMNVVPTKHNIYVLDDITNSETKSSTNDIQIKSAVLFDLNGLKILEFKSNYFDISTVKKGVYILKVQTNDELITSKIVVK